MPARTRLSPRAGAPVSRWVRLAATAGCVLVVGACGSGSATTSAPATSAAPPRAPVARGFVAVPSSRTTTAQALPGGTYAMWEKQAQRVLFVRDGKVVRTAPTTANLAKTPPGTYHVRYRLDPGAEYDDGIRYLLPYFMEFGPVPGHEGIGFHGVPVTPSGHYLQPLDTVGEAGYESHGCLRLRPDDAAFAWHFLGNGATVRVVE